jgi:hypothetical protein
MKKVFTLFIIAFLFSGMIQAQEKTTMSVKDLNSDISKYIKKNYKDYKTMEAFKYELVYVMTIRKGDATDKLVFNREGKFQYKATEADKAKVSFQTRSTMSLKDVESDITKYIKKNYEGYKLTEAFRYDEVYVTKIIKGDDAESLIFDKEGKFEKKVAAPQAAEETKKADSVPPKAGETKNADTTKKK